VRPLALALALAVALAGCSIVTVDGPPPAPRPRRFQCTESSLAPAVDAGVALGAVLVSSLFLPEEPEVGYTALGVGAVEVGSVFVGYARVSACRNAQAEARAAQGWRAP
jgi:hypothetical protein